MTGVVIGKFYPPHRGHQFLIEFARARVDRLVVIVCDHPEQTISGNLRAAWLREIHPEVEVVVTPDDLPDEPVPWAKRTIEILGRAPDVVFTSEAYGPGWAAAMGCEHVFADPDRSQVPISATRIRQDPFANWEFLAPCVRSHFVKRIVLIGVESTGKTTLAEQLAAELNTIWVPEYGREYSLTQTGEWATEDFIKIAAEQQRRENEAARFANRVLICDTNAVATCVWHRRYMGFHAPEVDTIGNQDRVDLYLLTLPDFPFVQDGTRDGELIRLDMHEWFLAHLAKQPAPVVEIGGSREERGRKALLAIQEIAKWPTDSGSCA